MVTRTVVSTTVHDRITALAAAHTELARAVARGQPALRNGPVILGMNPDLGYPVLTSAGADSGVTFHPDGLIMITSADGAVDSDMSLRHLTASGDINATGNTNVGGIVSSNGVDAGGGTIATSGQFTAGGTVINPSGFNAPAGTVTAYAVAAANVTSTSTAAFGGVVYANAGITLSGQQIVTGTSYMNAIALSASTVYGQGAMYSPAFIVSSDRDLKTNIGAVDETLIDGLLAAPVRSWEWRPRPATTGPDGEEQEPSPLPEGPHFSILAQDAPEVLQRRHPETGDLGIDTTSYNGLLLAAVQRQAAQIAALTARLDALDATVT